VVVVAQRERPAAPVPAGRPAWWRELALILVTYGAYTLTRNTLPAHRARAEANARSLYDLEQRLHVDVEKGLNDLVAGHGTNWLSVLADYTYSLSHLSVTVAVLGWLYAARPHAYRAARTAVMVATVLALVGFWLYPLAPPRFFPGLGFVDTVVRDGTWGSWADNAVADSSNQYAAMPSVHLVWALWSAGAVALWARRRWLRVLAPLYPLTITFVILGTANHWVLDAVGAVAVLAAGVVAARAGPLLSSRAAGAGR
jgi:hypothetical protein